MTDWIDTDDWRRWTQRVLAPRPLLLVLLVGALFVAELRFDWLERILGAYLVSSNHQRPEYGAIWEKGKKTRTARKTLEKIVTDREAVQREIRKVASVTQLADSLSTGQGAVLSPEQFRRLYLQLPETVSQRTLPVFELLKLSSAGSWRRTYVERTESGLEIYLLDAGNRVLHQADIGKADLRQMEESLIPETATLDSLPRFRERIYPADAFFSALTSFPEDVRRSVLPHPERLLAVEGQIRRVGISDETGDGFIELGFEIADGTRVGVIRTRGGEWSVWRLRSLLEAETVRSASDPAKTIGAPL